VSDEEFVVVVEISPALAADQTFEAWVRARGLVRDAIADDIRVDTFRTARGVERRYLVRRGLLGPVSP
jgi:hypothetical protein